MIGINTMQHDTIKFNSINPDQVKYFATVLKDYSKDDIKLNKIPGRHALLLNMALAGDSPLSDEYMHIRGLAYEMIESQCENDAIPWHSTKSTIRERIREGVYAEILECKGWDLTSSV